MGQGCRVEGGLGSGRSFRLARRLNRLLPWGWRLTHPGMGDDRLGRGLFIIGHARSGTTILQNALNDVSDIFLLGEADLHLDPGTPDFRERYNERQRRFGNLANKSSFCPKLFEHDAAWPAYLTALERRYRYVGAKIVINPDGAEAASDQLFDFACQHYYQAHYIVCFRNPIDVLCSTQGLAVFQGLPPERMAILRRSYLIVMRLYLRLLCNLPNVSVWFLESVSPIDFARLGTRLGLDLSSCHRYYAAQKIRHYAAEDIAGGDAGLLAALMLLYVEFRRHAQAGFDLVQIEQNAASVDPTHPTPLGRLTARIEALLAAP
jgi:Sulfotransferase family